MPSVIRATGLHRKFVSLKKEPGLQGALQALFSPKYSSHDALKGVSFEIEEGAFVGLVGANGAGKTTLLKILSGLIPPTSGTAEVLGFNPFSRPMEFRRAISLVMGQKAQLWWDLPALDAFELLKVIYEIPQDLYRKRLDELTELLAVKPLLHTQIRRLSLGERMKMELIGAILHAPKIIFLDEPTIGLDVLAAYKLREFLLEHNRREKATIILTSHNMDDIERLCSRVLILRSGEFIYDGPPGTLVQKGERRLKVRFLDEPSIDRISEVSGVPKEKIEQEDDSVAIHVTQDQSIGILQRLMEYWKISDIGFEEPSLEQVIHRIYDGHPTP